MGRARNLNNFEMRAVQSSQQLERPGDTEQQQAVSSTESRPVLVTKSIVVIGTLLMSFIILEVGLRVSGRYRMGSVSGYLQPGGLSYVLKKNARKTIFWPAFSWNVYTCDLGFRATRPGPRNLDGKPYYAVLGSSDSFGNGLDYEKTFIGVLDEKMDAHGIDVVNMSIAGHHLQEQAALFKEFARSTTNHPATVLVFFNPNFIGGYDDNHTNVVVRRGELFPKEGWKMAMAKMIVANSSATYCFFRDTIRKAQQKYIGREDFSLSFYVQRFSNKHPIRQPEKSQDFLKHLKDLTDFIRSVNATPICVYCPPAGQIDLNNMVVNGKLERGLIDTQFFVDIVRQHCDAEGIRFINLEPPVQERYNKGEKLNFDADGHYNGPTSRMVGEYLYKMLLAPADQTALN
jgi:hypothetical protein